MSSFNPRSAIEPDNFVRVKQSSGKLGETMWVVTAVEGQWANIRQVDPQGRTIYKEQQVPTDLLQKV